MARLPRLDLAGVAQHVVQRGNDRQACFADDGDYLHYRQELGEAALKHDCAVHAYVLMTNHVHLLVTPQAMGAVSRMMQAIGRRYVGCFNARYHRTGTLWEGRFKAAVVDSDTYVMRCHRYIECNPVRAGMVATAGDYRWSSHQHNAHGSHEPRLIPHPTYLALGATEDERRAAYLALFAEDLAKDEVDTLRLNTRQQKAWGSERFRAQIEALTQRAAAVRPRGRPPTSRDK
ncbi:transposase [Luteimonas sp. 50]|uniref:Transposase n=1 Tax=Cognatiluteimonas sedimenti TaxID=2927791 RepID=A0ABT0A0J9_9GAMM|nr:transposase [Lysobacter sedimenti]MCJ0824506.1 transposase [Lysobacter sedimenti]